MTENTTVNQKTELLGEEIKQQFIKAGEDAKAQLLDNFNKLLENDINNMHSIVERTIRENNRMMQVHMQRSLESAIKRQFGGSIFGGIVRDVVLPTVFQGISGGGSAIASQGFREAAGQTLLELGKAIVKAQGRNG